MLLSKEISRVPIFSEGGSSRDCSYSPGSVRVVLRATAFCVQGEFACLPYLCTFLTPHYKTGICVCGFYFSRRSLILSSWLANSWAPLSPPSTPLSLSINLPSSTPSLCNGLPSSLTASFLLCHYFNFYQTYVWLWQLRGQDYLKLISDPFQSLVKDTIWSWPSLVIVF